MDSVAHKSDPPPLAISGTSVRYLLSCQGCTRDDVTLAGSAAWP